MRTLPRLLFPVLFLVLMPACAALKSCSPLFERVGRSNLLVGELRIRMGDMARRFPGVLEATADVAAERSQSDGTREALLRFKSNAVPVMQSTLLQPDPVAALIDGWTLLAQLKQSLPTGLHQRSWTPSSVRSRSWSRRWSCSGGSCRAARTCPTCGRSSMRGPPSTR
ncbi:hypothetical protein [Cystobacter fuscus]|uniref:hypothetical protein n=1 Tax=Cystobacter fuscus TaxID=43 RepID=UPI0037BEB475